LKDTASPNSVNYFSRTKLLSFAGRPTTLFAHFQIFSGAPSLIPDIDTSKYQEFPTLQEAAEPLIGMIDHPKRVWLDATGQGEEDSYERMKPAERAICPRRPLEKDFAQFPREGAPEKI
jgi:hypothetical protein